MNTIQTTKANSTIRRFFSRMGGGGVKALNYKAVNIGNEEGGGTSNEDAEKMYEALFGQTPYVFIMPEGEEEPALVPLYEAFTTDIGTETGGALYYKSSTPVPKATLMETEDGVTTIIFPLSSGIYMMELPAEATGMPDTWYMPVEYDVNLIGYTTPTSGNPTTVSGTLPDKEEIEALVNIHPAPGRDFTDEYIWDDREHAFMHEVGVDTFYVLKQSDDNVIEWSYEERFS